MNTQFSPRVSLAQNAQYDTVTKELGWQARFRWIQRPGDDLYVVLVATLDEGADVARPHAADADDGHVDAFVRAAGADEGRGGERGGAAGEQAGEFTA